MSPGCSPTSTMSAVRGPAPKTTCSAFSYSSQARHSPAAAARRDRLSVSGTGAALVMYTAFPRPRRANRLVPLDPWVRRDPMTDTKGHEVEQQSEQGGERLVTVL